MPYLVEVLKTLSQDKVLQRFMEQNMIIYVSSQNRFQQRLAVLEELVKVLKIFSQFRVPRWCSEVEDLVQVLKALTQDRVPLRPLAVCHLRGLCFASRSWQSSWRQCPCQIRSFWRGAGPMVPVLGAKGGLLVDELHSLRPVATPPPPSPPPPRALLQFFDEFLTCPVVVRHGSRRAFRSLVRPILGRG